MKSFLLHYQRLVRTLPFIVAKLELFWTKLFYIPVYMHLLIISNIRHEVEIALEILRKMKRFENASAI